MMLRHPPIIERLAAGGILVCIYRRRRCIHELDGGVRSQRLEQNGEASDVVANKHAGVAHAVPHAGLRRKMDHVRDARGV